MRNLKKRITGRASACTSACHWWERALALHYATLCVVLLLCVLAACGSVPAAPPPAAYVWTDNATLLTLTWQEQQGNLSGKYTAVSYATTVFPFSSSPTVSGAAYSGTRSGASVTLTLWSGGSGSFSEHITGQQSSDGQTLILRVVDPTSGAMQAETWHAVNQAQQAALLHAFNAFEVVRGMLPVVARDARLATLASSAVGPGPGSGPGSSDPDPNAAQVQQVQLAVMQQLAVLAAIQQAQNASVQCQLIARFQPLAASSFTLLFPPAQNSLVRDEQTLAHAWATAQQITLPQITGLNAAHLPWLVLAGTYQRQSAQARNMAASIEATYQQDEQSMQQLRQQDQAIAQQVTTIATSCPPTPGG